MKILNRLKAAYRVLTSETTVTISIKDGVPVKVDWGNMGSKCKQDKQAVAAQFFKTAYNL